MKDLFILYAEKNQLTVRHSEPVTSGSGDAYRVRFEFSADWAGLKRMAVFKAGDTSVSILLDRSGACRLPWKVLTQPGVQLRAGVYGTRGGSVVLPTVWAGLGTIQEGVTGGEAAPPTDQWELELERKQNKLTGRPGQVVGFDGEGLAQAQDPAVVDHCALLHLDAEGQHPIQAIIGLEGELSKRLTADDAMSAVDIIKIMEG